MCAYTLQMVFVFVLLAYTLRKLSYLFLYDFCINIGPAERIIVGIKLAFLLSLVTTLKKFLLKGSAY